MRWIMLQTDTAGNVSLVLNNHAVNIPLGFAISAGTDHTILVSIDTSAGVIARFDGVRYPATGTIPLPGGFVWNNAGPPFFDQAFTNDDFSTANEFLGLWHWIYFANSVLN